MSVQENRSLLIVQLHVVLFFIFSSVVGILQAIPQSRNLALGSKPSGSMTQNMYGSMERTETFSNDRPLMVANDISRTNSNMKSKLNFTGKPSPAVAVPNLANSGISNRNLNRMDQQTQTDNEAVIFPSSKNVMPKMKLMPDEKEIKNCQENLIGSSLCGNSINYPTSLIQNLITTRNLSHIFYTDSSDSETDNGSQINTRLNPGDYRTFCDSRVMMKFPEVAKNKNNEWKYIVQGPNNTNFRQGVRVELCQNPNAACNIIDSIPNGYEIHCEQKFLVRRLYSLDDKTSEMIGTDLFDLPSCCVCVYRTSFETGFRMAAQKPTQPISKSGSPVPAVPLSAPIQKG